MLYSVYTIKDKLAEECGPPFVAVNDKVALRKYKDLGIPESLKHEYELLMIGLFDSKDCSITPHVVYSLVEEEKDA